MDPKGTIHKTSTAYYQYIIYIVSFMYENIYVYSTMERGRGGAVSINCTWLLQYLLNIDGIELFRLPNYSILFESSAHTCKRAYYRDTEK